MMFRRLLATLLVVLPLAALGQAPAAAPAPRLGTDYVVMTTPQPTYGQGKIEVAEVFGYTCIHCANLQPQINAWKKKLGPDVRFVYVPGVFGGLWDNFARAYFGAEASGLLDKTHDAMFKAVHIERKFTNGNLDEIANFYAGYGVNREAFLSTMQSFSVNAKMNRAKQFALRAGVNSTPSIIVAGKYKVLASNDRGLAGMLTTTDWLVAKERAAAAATRKPPATLAAPAPKKG